MRYDFLFHRKESGYRRYTSFVLRQDMDANIFVITNTFVFGANMFLTARVVQVHSIITRFLDVQCGARVGGALCYINNPTLRFLSHTPLHATGDKKRRSTLEYNTILSVLGHVCTIRYT